MKQFISILSLFAKVRGQFNKGLFTLAGLLLVATSSLNQPISQPSFEEPIDVVIPVVDKDLFTLNLCIDGIRANCEEVRRIIAISPRLLTTKAEWFSENAYPFSKQDVATALCKGDEAAAREYKQKFPKSLGWYYQQLLKLYAAWVIPDISSNILVLDADTVFLNPVRFINRQNEALYNVGYKHHLPYFAHGEKLIPGFKRIFPEYSGICHHMLLQKSVLEDLFRTVEKAHGMPFWQAFCQNVADDQLYKSGASEYEIYFNFIFSNPYQVKIRPLKWKNSSSLSKVDRYRLEGYHYVSFHTYLRQNQKQGMNNPYRDD